SGGGAGIQADMRSFALLGIHGLVAVTAVTVQNSLGVKGFHEIPPALVAGQIEAVASDIGLQAAKTGMLASSDIIEAIADTWVAQ
ncbi:bifunctional hydroxymethylpyrimidine kinase/phosphomethylpyrimidine kinase, partial [Mycobacterium sp. ITM-2017-0098]